MTRVYAQLYDYAVIIALRRNQETNVFEPYVKYKFPPQVRKTYRSSIFSGLPVPKAGFEIDGRPRAWESSAKVVWINM